MDAEALPFAEEFDAVFSNAVLHWITRADPMLEAVHRSLKPGGRFVAECGGFGCVDTIRAALVDAMNRRGIDGEALVPWYFPTPGDYAARLERAEEGLVGPVAEAAVQPEREVAGVARDDRVVRSYTLEDVDDVRRVEAGPAPRRCLLQR